MIEINNRFIARLECDQCGSESCSYAFESPEGAESWVRADALAKGWLFERVGVYGETVLCPICRAQPRAVIDPGQEGDSIPLRSNWQRSAWTVAILGLHVLTVAAVVAVAASWFFRIWRP